MDAKELYNNVTTDGWSQGFSDGCRLKIAKLERIKHLSLKLSDKYPRDNALILSVQQTDYMINNLKKAIKTLKLIDETFDDDEIMTLCESLTEII